MRTDKLTRMTFREPSALVPSLHNTLEVSDPVSRSTAKHDGLFLVLCRLHCSGMHRDMHCSFSGYFFMCEFKVFGFQCPLSRFSSHISAAEI